MTSCTSDEPKSPGRRVYVANCAICHTMDPARGGPQGPALTGASVELLEQKLLKGTYPQGYGPKRTTKMMPTFPHLKPFIPELAQYLNDRPS